MKENTKSPKKNVLGSLFKTAAMVYGFYQLLNLSIFKGKDFKTLGLTDEQIEAMDAHNKNHHSTDLVKAFGRGLGGGLGMVNTTAPEDIEKGNEAVLKKENESLDLDLVGLPQELQHRHTTK